MAGFLNESGFKMAYLTNFSSENFRKRAACSLSMNLISMHLIYHTRALQVSRRNWNPGGIYAERDLLPHILSCHCLQSNIVTRWQIVRGPQPDSCLRERGSGEAASSIRFLSPQQSIIIVYISTQNSLVNSAEQQGNPVLIQLCPDLRSYFFYGLSVGCPEWW